MKVLDREKYRIEVLKGAYETMAKDSLEFSCDIVRDDFDMFRMARYRIEWWTFFECRKYHNELIRILMVFLRAVGIRIRREGCDIDVRSRDFFDKVVHMREAQKKYFRTRSEKALLQSKRLEEEVDAEIKWTNDMTVFKRDLF